MEAFSTDGEDEIKVRSEAVFKGLVDKIGFDTVLAAIETHHQLEPGRVTSNVIDLNHNNDQLSISDGKVGFVSGEWHGQLTFPQAKDVLIDIIDEKFGFLGHS